MGDRETWRKNIPEDFDGRFGDTFDAEVIWKPIVQTTIGLVITCVVGFFVVEGLVWWNHGHVESNMPALSPLAEANEQKPPVGPRLQAHPEEELEEMKAEHAAHLNGYGWIDEAAGTVHIPIDQAIHMYVAEHGTPTTEDAAAETSVGDAEDGAAEDNAAAAADQGGDGHDEVDAHG